MKMKSHTKDKMRTTIGEVSKKAGGLKGPSVSLKGPKVTAPKVSSKIQQNATEKRREQRLEGKKL